MRAAVLAGNYSNLRTFQYGGMDALPGTSKFRQCFLHFGHFELDVRGHTQARCAAFCCLMSALKIGRYRADLTFLRGFYGHFPPSGFHVGSPKYATTDGAAPWFNLSHAAALPEPVVHGHGARTSTSFGPVRTCSSAACHPPPHAPVQRTLLALFLVPMRTGVLPLIGACDPTV